MKLWQRRETVLVMAGQPASARQLEWCHAQGLRAELVPPAADGGLSLSNLDRRLSGDCADAIVAVLVDSHASVPPGQDIVAAVRAVLDRCWHDAALVVDGAAVPTELSPRRDQSAAA